MKTLKSKQTLRTESEVKFNIHENAGNVIGHHYFNGNETPILEQVNGKTRELLRGLLLSAWEIKQNRSKRGTIFYSTYIERALTHGDLDFLTSRIPEFKISFYQASKSAYNYRDTQDCQNFIQIHQNRIEIVLGRGTGSPEYQSFSMEIMTETFKNELFGVYFEELDAILNTEFSYSYIKNDRY